MLSNILKLILGVIMAIAILAGGGVAVGFYLMNRASIAPPKPVFSNDKAEVKAEAAKNPTPGAIVNSQEKSTPQPTPTESPLAEKPLPPGAYSATVTWAEGLILRAEPKVDAERLGGVGFNAKVTVLELSDDKTWEKIRIEGSEQEGWVKAGNTKKAE